MLLLHVLSYSSSFTLLCATALHMVNHVIMPGDFMC